MGRRLLSMYAAIAAGALLAGGCSSNNFMVYKNAKHFYVTSKGAELKRVLCDSGDMDKIAVDSKLPVKMQQELKEGICGSDKVKERLMASLDGMTRDQRAALKNAFENNGYDINVVANC